MISPRRRCGAEDETSAYIHGECEDLVSHVHLGSIFLDPKDIKSLSLGAISEHKKRDETLDAETTSGNVA